MTNSKTISFEDVRAKVDGIPHMDARQGRIVYDHVRESRPQLVLELGTACGVSAAYISAALQANGAGKMVSLDLDTAPYTPAPTEVLGSVDLTALVDLVRVPDSSYVWWLRQQIRDRSDAQGNCDPQYDFVFIDGAHEFTIDGLATVLAMKLLRPGGWLLLDDLDWAHSGSQAVPPFAMSPGQLATPNMREVFDVIVCQHPDFDRFEIQNDQWGWARKGTGPRTLRLDTAEPDLPTRAVRKVKGMAARAIRR